MLAFEAGFVKGAGVVSDVLGPAIVGGTILAPANLAGWPGLLGSRPSDKEMAEIGAAGGSSYIPGVGAYRLGRRFRRSAADAGTSVLPVLAENISPLTSAIAPTLLGGLIGGSRGAVAGGLLGGALPTLAGMGAAAATPTWTDKDLKAPKSSLEALLVPGVGSYRNMKRLGHSGAKYDKKED